MDRKAIARETLDILDRGGYEGPEGWVDIREAQERAAAESRFIPEEEVPVLPDCPRGETRVRLAGCSTVRALLDLAAEGRTGVAVLNFASAKNPGGGFLNGAMAQEESLAASGGLYRTLTRHEEYYRRNRACGHMRYTGCAIWSPEVPFFRDEEFRLLPKPVTASVLTLPAVNLGQVIQKGEDIALAKRAMGERMERALALFAAMGARELVLGAYGCGVFRNDPGEVARRWKELLELPEFAGRFAGVTHAVLDRSKSRACWRAFEAARGKGGDGCGQKQG